MVLIIQSSHRKASLCSLSKTDQAQGKTQLIWPCLAEHTSTQTGCMYGGEGRVWVKLEGGKVKYDAGREKYPLRKRWKGSNEKWKQRWKNVCSLLESPYSSDKSGTFWWWMASFINHSWVSYFHVWMMGLTRCNDCSGLLVFAFLVASATC